MKKQPRQKKSRMYYYFWAVMTATVLLGQIYVGTGYRVMAGEVLRLTNFLNSLTIEREVI
jgi:hypothetical protein|tara:strand:+ start:2870 stop:3049 length:180 start_codon:yes stop_codon:yes gene_type:complete